jgi:hypothetical protein
LVPTLSRELGVAHVLLDREPMRSQVLILALAACSSSQSGDDVDTSTADTPATTHASSAVLLPGKPHGLFVLLNKDVLQQSGPRIMARLLCRGPGDPLASCTAKGAGFDAVRGATYQVQWNDVQPDGSAQPDWSTIRQLAHDWNAAGKQLNLVFETGPYTGTTSFTPPWYSTPVAITKVTQTQTDIHITTAATIGFFVGPVTGAAPQSIQIQGTGTNLDGRSFPITSFSNTRTSLDAQGDPADAGVTATRGTVGNPMYQGSCTTAAMPVMWAQNFINAWQNLMSQTRANLDDGSIGYLRFGLGIGGENSPATSLDADCKTLLHELGFTADTTWPVADTTAWQNQIAKPWVDYQTAMANYQHNLGFATQLSFSLSPIQYEPTIDKTTPDHTAAAAVAAGLAIGNQGWRASDQDTYAAGQPCSGDWCALFDTYRGQVPLQLQSTRASNPDGTGTTGSLVPMLSFAIARHAQILEIYADDWLCTYDPTDPRAAACATAGYAAAFASAAARLN